METERRPNISKFRISDDERPKTREENNYFEYETTRKQMKTLLMRLTLNSIFDKAYLAWVIPIAISVLFFAGCSPLKKALEDIAPSAQVTLDQHAVSLEVNDAVTLNASVTGSTSTPNLLWTSSAPLVVTVNSLGEVSALAIGSATIKVYIEDDVLIADSCIITTTTDISAPSAPGDFQATVGDTQLSLSWTNSTDADFKSTVVRYATTGYPASPTAGFLVYSGPGTGFTHPNLVNGTTYYYSLFAKDTANNSSSAAQISGVPVDSTAPSPPYNFTAVKSDGKITLSWTNPPNDFAGVHIRRSEISRPETITSGELVYDGDLEGAVDTGRVNETVYYYRIWSYDRVENFSETSADITANGVPVLFQDLNFESLIRDTIGQPNGLIFSSALSGVETLDASRRNLSNIEGIQYLESLNYLLLGEGQISDIGPISGLTNLTYFSIGDHQVSDLSALSGLTKLARISIHNNPISDISALSELTSLATLALYANQVSNIEALSGLTNLTSIWLRSNQISDISPLSGS